MTNRDRLITIAARVTPEIKEQWNSKIELMKSNNWTGEKLSSSEVLRRLIVNFLQSDYNKNGVVFDETE